MDYFLFIDPDFSYIAQKRSVTTKKFFNPIFLQFKLASHSVQQFTQNVWCYAKLLVRYEQPVQEIELFGRGTAEADVTKFIVPKHACRMNEKRTGIDYNTISTQK